MAKFPTKRLICKEKVVKEGGRLTKNKSDWKFVVRHEDHKFRPHFMLNICNAWEIIKPINTNLEEKHFATRGENIPIRSNQVQDTVSTKIQSKVYFCVRICLTFSRARHVRTDFGSYRYPNTFEWIKSPTFYPLSDWLHADIDNYFWAVADGDGNYCNIPLWSGKNAISACQKSNQNCCGDRERPHLRLALDFFLGMSWTPKFYLPQQQKVLMHKVFRALDNYAWKVAWLMMVEVAAAPLWNAYKASCQILRPAKKRDLLSNPSDQLLIFLRFGSAMILHFQAATTMQCSKEGRNLVPYRKPLFMPTLDS